jgi:hypothetical protein
MNIDEYEASLQGGQDTASLEEAVKQIREEPETPAAPEPEQPEPDVKADDPSDKEPEVKEMEPPKEAEPEKPKQTPEENARYAEQRRQQQVEKRVQDELARLRNEDPAFKLAKTLENLYGMPVDQIANQIEQARIAKEAEDRNVPVAQVQQEYTDKAQVEQEKVEIQSVKDENVNLQFQLWQNRLATEELELRKAPELASLTPDEIEQARNYMLQVMQNPNAKLEEAVYAVHGRKIAENLRTIARNDALAEISGRNKGGLPPQGGKSAQTPTLTDDERYVAKQLGLSEDEYLKWKT